MNKFEEPNGSPENPGQIKKAMADHFLSEVKTRQDLLHKKHWPDLKTKFNMGKKEVKMPVSNIVAIEPAQEDGNFWMHLKKEVQENQGTVILVTGAALLAGAAAIHLSKKRKS